MYTGIRLLLIHPFISSFFFLSNVQILKIFITLFSGTVRLESLNLVHLSTMGGCIVYTRIRLLPLICPFISSFFSLSNYQTLTFFITLFSGTVRPETWYRCGQSVHVSCIQELGCCCLFVPVLVHFSFSPSFSYKFVFLH